MNKDTVRELDPVDLDKVRVFGRDPIFDDLFESIVSISPDEIPLGTDELVGDPPVRLGRRPKDVWWVRSLTAAAVVLLLVLGLTVGSGPTTNGNRLVDHESAWRPPQHVVTRTFGSESSGKGKWQLVADVYGVGWQQDSNGPPPGQLTCAAVDACFAMAGHYTSPRGGAPFLGESFYASSDLGETWTAFPMPSGLFPTTGLSCPSVLACAVGGTIGNEDVFAETTDGGHQWSVRPLASSERLLNLVCISADSCSAVTTTHNDLIAGLVQTSPNPDRTEWLLDTSDGGTTWAAHAFQTGKQVLGLSCPRPGTCVILGVEPSSATPGGPGTSFTQTTTDSGAHWSSGTLPAGVFINTPLASGLSCADTQHCMALVEGTVPNVDECQGTPPNAHPPAGSQSCSTGATTESSAVISTEDGGTTWQIRPLPSDVPLPQLRSVSCAVADTCWISGSDAQPMQIGTVSDGGSPLLIGTSDGGASWHIGSFQVPANAPNYLGQAYISIGSISCPTSSSCVAVGVGAQSAPSVPVYRYGG